MKELTRVMCALIVVLTLLSFTPQVWAVSPSVVDYPVPGVTNYFKLDGGSNPWFTWEHNFIRVNAGGSGYSTYSMPSGLYPYGPEAFDFDSEGNIWYATTVRDYQAGINTVNIVKFNYSQNSHQTYTFQFNDWDYGVNIRNVLVDKNDVVWIVNDNPTAGSNYRCLLEFNPAHPEQLPYYLMPDVTNTNLQVFDNDGNIWLTNYRNSLHKFDVASHQYQKYTYPATSVYQMPLDIDFDSSGNIWMVLYGYGSGANLLVKYNPTNGDYQEINMGFSGAGSLCVDSKDEVWVADIATHSINRTDGVSILDIFDRGDYYIFGLKAALDGSVWSSECWFGMDANEARISHFAATDTTPPDLSISISPDTLNLKSKGKWVTAYIELAENYDVVDIDVSTIKLDGTVPAETQPAEIGDYDNDGTPDLMVKFDRASIQDILDVGDEVEIIITGELADGTSFEGKDTIRVIDKGKER